MGDGAKERGGRAPFVRSLMANFTSSVQVTYFYVLSNILRIKVEVTGFSRNCLHRVCMLNAGSWGQLQNEKAAKP